MKVITAIITEGLGSAVGNNHSKFIISLGIFYCIWKNCRVQYSSPLAEIGL